jgi:hypothetical protein
MQAGVQVNGLGAKSHRQSLGRADEQCTPQRAANLCPESPRPVLTCVGPLEAATDAPYAVVIDTNGD